MPVSSSLRCLHSTPVQAPGLRRTSLRTVTIQARKHGTWLEQLRDVSVLVFTSCATADYSHNQSETQSRQAVNIAESVSLFTNGQSNYASFALGSKVPSVTQAPEYSQQDTPQHYQQYQQHYGVPQYPGPPPQYQQKSSGGGLPSLLWVAIGIGIATVFSKIYGVVSAPGGVQGWVRAMPLSITGTSASAEAQLRQG